MTKLAVVVLVLSSATAQADRCRIIDLEFTPGIASDPTKKLPPQIVGWFEDTNGTYIDTVYITQTVGRFGLGNRPGRFDFNSAPLWPYGRRTTTFPVWSTKQPLRWPELVFQDSKDDNLSHESKLSSADFHYCTPLLPEEFDSFSCASQTRSDKGVFSATKMTGYPPRDDLNPLPQDQPSVGMFAMMNPFDTVSQPTPLAGELAHYSYAIATTVPAGNYVMWLEVAKEFDMNATYNESVYPSPVVSYSQYGLPYRGQPSVLYRIPFQILDNGEMTASTENYVGYGDPDGLDGAIRAPDSTITTTEPGSGAARLALISKDGSMYRARLTMHGEIDFEAPDPAGSPTVIDVYSNRATISFLAPGDDGLTGTVQAYEIRYRVGESITAENFDTAPLMTAAVPPVPGGGEQTFTLEGLLPETSYSVGIRAVDNCRNVGELSVVELTTPERPAGQVDACFIATAAYGSLLARDVEHLRHFRDGVLSRTVLGELAIESYYTFGPALAGMIGESDLLRSSARSALDPIVSWVKNLGI